MGSTRSNSISMLPAPAMPLPDLKLHVFPDVLSSLCSVGRLGQYAAIAAPAPRAGILSLNQAPPVSIGRDGQRYKFHPSMIQRRDDAGGLY